MFFMKKTSLRSATSTKHKTRIITFGIFGVSASAALAAAIFPAPSTSVLFKQNGAQAKVETCKRVCMEQFSYCPAKRPFDVCQMVYDKCIDACVGRATTSTNLPGCQLVVEHTGITPNPEEGMNREAVPDRWYPFDAYRVRAVGGDVMLSAVGVIAGLDGASFSSVGVFGDGHFFGRSSVASGTLSRVRVAASSSWMIPRDTALDLSLQGILAPVMASSSVRGASVGVARSGQGVMLGLASNDTSTPWGSAFANRYNIEARCRDSGSPVYVAASRQTDVGPLFFSRKGVLSVMGQPLPSTSVLSRGEMDVLRVRLINGVNPVALKKMTFLIQREQPTDGALTLSRFRLLLDAREIPASDYHLYDGFGYEIGERILFASSTERSITVTAVFDRELTLNSARDVTLRATVGGVIRTNDRLVTVLAHDVGHEQVTGYLTSEFELDEGVTPRDISAFRSYFLWSDMSEIPHRDSPGLNEGSRDWITSASIPMSSVRSVWGY